MTATNGLRELVNRTMEEEGTSLTQATNKILKQLNDDGQQNLEEIRKIQDVREETGLVGATDPVSRAIDQELQIEQLNRIRGGGNGGGSNINELMNFLVLSDAIDTRAYNRQMRTLEIEAAKKKLDGGITPEVEKYLDGIRDKYEEELDKLRPQITSPPQEERQKALPQPDDLGPLDESPVAETFSEAMKEAMTPVYEALTELLEKKEAGKPVELEGDLVTKLDNELRDFNKQKERIEGIAISMGWKKADAAEGLNRLANRHELVADIRDVVDVIKYAGDELGIAEKFQQLFGAPPAEKTLTEFDHYQTTQTMEPKTEAERLIKEKNLTRHNVEQLRLCSYDDLDRAYMSGEYSEFQVKQLKEWKAILCDDQAMLTALRGKQLPVPPDEPAAPKCECGAVLVDGMCPKCEVKDDGTQQ